MLRRICMYVRKVSVKYEQAAKVGDSACCDVHSGCLARKLIKLDLPS